MASDALLQELRTLEESLQRCDVRRNRVKLDALLHPDFVEFGRSGQSYTKREIVDLLTGEQTEPLGWVGDYALQVVADDVALLTYRTARKTPSGEYARHTLRASLWKRVPSGWQLLFHQGTPTERPVFET